MESYIQTETGRVYRTQNVSAWNGVKVLRPLEGKNLLIKQCRDDLTDILIEGETIYCVLRHVSSSGMSRNIDFYAIKGNRPVWLSGQMSPLLGLKRAKSQGLIVQGCGMDMGFHVVSNLAYRLFGAEKALKHDWI